MWEEVSSKCLAKLRVFSDGLNRTNRELTSNPPAFLSEFFNFKRSTSCSCSASL